MSDENKVSEALEHDDAGNPADQVNEELTDYTRTTTSEAPNGGLHAWLQVAGAFCLYLNTWWVWNELLRGQS